MAKFFGQLLRKDGISQCLLLDDLAAVIEFEQGLVEGLHSPEIQKRSGDVFEADIVDPGHDTPKMRREEDRGVDPRMAEVVELLILREAIETCRCPDLREEESTTGEPLANATLGAFLDDDFEGLAFVEAEQVGVPIKAHGRPAAGRLDTPMFRAIFKQRERRRQALAHHFSY